MDFFHDIKVLPPTSNEENPEGIRLLLTYRENDGTPQTLVMLLSDALGLQEMLTEAIKTASASDICKKNAVLRRFYLFYDPEQKNEEPAV